jgi:hypothetical protein
VQPPPADDDEPKILERLLTIFFLRQNEPAVVLAPSIRLADHAELVPVEIRASDELAVAIEYVLLRFRGRQAQPRQHQPARGFQRRLRATVGQAHSSTRGPDARPSSAEIEHVGDLLVRDHAAVKRRVDRCDGHRRRPVPREVDDTASDRCDVGTGNRADVPGAQLGPVQVDGC